MVNTTNNVLQDAVALWRRGSRNFLDYVVEVATPVELDDLDAAIIGALRVCYQAEMPVNERLLDLLVRLGKRPDKPPFSPSMGQFNYVRGRNLGTAFLEAAAPEIEILRSHGGRYEVAESLEERLFRGILRDYIAVREDCVKAVRRLLDEDAKAQALSRGEAPEEAEEAPGAAVDNPYPWHDEALSLEERMKLAEGKGLFEKLFAAMAQTDCTACGYDCEGYARAIAEGEDTDLSKCAPGMDETREELKKLMGK